MSAHSSSISPAEATTVCDSLLSRAIEVQWGFFGHSRSFKVSEECVSSLSAALKTLTREVTNRVPNPHASQIRFASIVPRLVSILAAKIAYPTSYTHGDVEDCEEDAMFDFYRETLCSLAYFTHSLSVLYQVPKSSSLHFFFTVHRSGTVHRTHMFTIFFSRYKFFALGIKPLSWCLRDGRCTTNTRTLLQSPASYTRRSGPQTYCLRSPHAHLDTRHDTLETFSRLYLST